METAVLAVLAIVFLAGAPFAAQATGAWAHAIVHRVQARWTAPDGKTDPPLQDSQVAEETVSAEIAAVLALAILLTITGLLARRTLDKRRGGRLGRGLAHYRATLDHSA